MKRHVLAALVCSALFGGALLYSTPAAADTTPLRPLGKSELTLGTGVMGYFSGSAGGIAGTWDVRYGYRAFSFLTFEGGYQGAAGDAPGPGGVTATFIEGDGKVTFLGYNRRVIPYGVAGVGWGAFSGFDGQRSDNSTVTIPLGAGLDLRMTDHLSVGGRAIYRIVAADAIGNLHASADNLGITARVAASF